MTFLSMSSGSQGVEDGSGRWPDAVVGGAEGNVA